jgi:hypothetical protein
MELDMLILSPWLWLVLLVVFGLLASWAKMRCDLNRSVRMNRPLLFRANAFSFLTIVSTLMLVLSIVNTWMQTG